ncbi:MAG: hypothetical protein ACI9MB_004360, partial [Verrucomicrobiales bacterium]
KSDRLLAIVLLGVQIAQIRSSKNPSYEKIYH